MAKEKLYYSIREMAEMFNINQSNLRYWEKEFKQLKPRRNAKGTRFYTKKDIQTVKTIIYLINEQKLTLEGVRIKLNEKKDKVQKQQEISERLTKVRDELKGMIASLEQGKEIMPAEESHDEIIEPIPFVTQEEIVEEKTPKAPETLKQQEQQQSFPLDLFS